MKGEALGDKDEKLLFSEAIEVGLMAEGKARLQRAKIIKLRVGSDGSIAIMR